MIPISVVAANVQPSRIRAIATLADEYPGTLRLFVGEDTLPTPDFIKRAAQQAIDTNKTYYTPNAGYLEVREGIADHLRFLHGVHVDPARQIVVTSSGMNAIVLACQATVGPGSSAIVLTPLWPNTSNAVRVTGAEAIEFPLDFSAKGFQLDFDKLEATVKPTTRLLALASPGNPTGWMASHEDWERIADFCEKHGLWLLADAVYERIVFDGTVAPSPFAIPRLHSRLIVAQSFSKAYRMTGWRIGYVVAPPELGRIMANLQEFVVSNAPGVVQLAALAGLQQGEPMIAESQKRYRLHKDITMKALSGLEGVEITEPAGAFYVFPRLRGLTDSVAFCEHLVREYRLGIAPGSAFGTGGEGHVRICFAVEEAILRDALARFVTAWTSERRRLDER
jgi:aspartate/methionine/tyrosine aminotransferase